MSELKTKRIIDAIKLLFSQVNDFIDTANKLNDHHDGNGGAPILSVSDYEIAKFASIENPKKEDFRPFEDAFDNIKNLFYDWKTRDEVQSDLKIGFEEILPGCSDILELVIDDYRYETCNVYDCGFMVSKGGIYGDQHTHCATEDCIHYKVELFATDDEEFMCKMCLGSW